MEGAEEFFCRKKVSYYLIKRLSAQRYFICFIDWVIHLGNALTYFNIEESFCHIYHSSLLLSWNISLKNVVSNPQTINKTNAFVGGAYRTSKVPSTSPKIRKPNTPSNNKDKTSINVVRKAKNIFSSHLFIFTLQSWPKVIMCL